MGLDQWFGIVLTGVFVIVFGALVTRAYMRARVWCEGTHLVAKKYRLTYVPLRGGLSLPSDKAMGEHRGLSFEIAVDTESRGRGDRRQDVRFARLEVYGRWSRRLVLQASTAQKPKEDGVIDYGAAPRKDRATPVDPTFDAAVEVRNASPALVQALRTSNLRDLVLELSPFGLKVEDSKLVLRSRRFPKSPQELVERVDRMVAVAEHLKHLD